MSTELEHAPRPVGVLEEKKNYALALAQSGLLPDAYKKQPANVLLAMELGEALRIPPIQAINGVHVIKGKPSMSADLMAAIVRRAGHKLRVIENRDPLAVTAEIVRADDPDFTFRATWDEQKARAAGLWGSGNWQTYASQMLRARAVSEVCRQAASDALMGVIYTPEELGGAPTSETDGSWPTEHAEPTAEEVAEGPSDLTDVTDAEVVEDEVGEQSDPESEPEAPGVPLITQAQLKALHATLADQGIADRDAGLEVISNLAGRRIETTKDLTMTEASMVLDALKRDAFEGPR